jgi:uncharacterized glyoxalase superfamily protein PhnB
MMQYVPDVDAIHAKVMTLGCVSMMPPTDMFWGDRFRKLTDPFGHQWGAATHIKSDTRGDGSRPESDV